MITLLKRLGHSISYNVVEELETKFTYSDLSAENILPSEIRDRKNSFCGLTFDNYNRYVETLSVTNTLHDTMGIFIAKTFKIQPLQKTYVLMKHNFFPESKRCRRKFETPMKDIEPYRKKPKMSETILNVDDPRFDRLRLYEDFSPRQKNFYLPQIDMSPTSSAVVAETLKIAK